MHTVNIPVSESSGLKRASFRALVQSADCQLPIEGIGPKSALVALTRLFDDRTGQCRGSNQTIGKLMGRISKEQAGRYIAALCAVRVGGRALVSKIARPGETNAYVIHLDVLASLDDCKPVRSAVDNSVSTPVIEGADPCHFSGVPLSYMPVTPVMDDNRTGKGTVSTTEEGTEARAPAAAQVEAAFPPFSVFEDLKTEPPKTAVDDVLGYIADTRAEGLPISGYDLRSLIEAAAASGEMPLAVAADAVRGCLPALAAPAALAAMPAIDPAKQARLNARRQAAGKPALTARDLCDLAAEADKAGRSLDSLLDLMDAKGWLFARADWKGVKQEAAPVPARPDELTADAMAAAAIRAAAISTAPLASPETRARYVALLAVQRAAIAAQAVAPVAAVGGLDLTGQPGWVVENVRKLHAGLPVGHMARVRTAEMLGVARARLESLQAEVV